MPDAPSTGRLLIACPDARGIVAAVAGFLSEHGANLLDADQHTDAEHGEFFMRAEFDLAGCDLDRAGFAGAWSPLAERYSMDATVNWSTESKRIAILVSRHLHCLHDLLWRREAGDLDAEIALVASNHPDAAPLAKTAGIPFHHLPIDRSVADDKRRQERALADLLESSNVDLVVLARYMQILSPDFVRAWARRVINIHHSFLPAFAGGNPYRQAYERGVKVIGATSHYVTAELDAGPIIAQAVTEVSHRHTVADLQRKGRDLERMVLAQAVRKHLDDKILVSGNKTVVFG